MKIEVYSLNKVLKVAETVNIIEHLIIIALVHITAKLDNIQMRFTIILVANGDLGV